MLIRRYHESLDTLNYAIDRHERRLPYSIANSQRLGGKFSAPEQLQTEIQMAKERLAWFVPFVSLIDSVEILLLELPSNEAKFLEKQWHAVINYVGDLTVPQIYLHQTALHCDSLAQGWDSVATCVQRLKILIAKPPSPLLDNYNQSFFAAWDRLWTHMFALNDPNAHGVIKDAIKQFVNLQALLMEIE